MKEASKGIGLSVTLTKILSDQGFLTPIDGPTVSGNKRYLFAESTISEFIALVSKYAIESGNRGKMISFGVLLRAHYALGFSTEAALALISEGHLRPMKSIEHVSSLADLRFSKHELSLILSSIPPSPSTVTRAWVIRHLKVNKRTVQYLIKEGHLRETTGRGKQRPIIKQSFELFESKWIKIGLIARRMGTSRMLAARALIMRNIESIICKHDTSVASFFDREAALSLSDFDKDLDRVALYRGKTYSEYMAIRKEQGRQTV